MIPIAAFALAAVVEANNHCSEDSRPSDCGNDADGCWISCDGKVSDFHGDQG